MEPAETRPAGEVRLRGRVPAGEVVLPVPLYGRVVDLAASPPARTAQGRDGLTMLFADAATDLSYRVALGQAPDFDGGDEVAGDLPAPPASLLAATVPDSELPDETLWFLDELADGGAGALERALAVREFIRTRYRYDPSYLEDEGVARWLRDVSASRPNVHIAALHAGRDGRSLGRGVCYDLNVLACELLRRAGLPAAVATGWPFTGGALAEPDHLWAMALVPTAAGWRWFPIDAATTAEGRPLQTPRRPAGPWRVAPQRGGAAAKLHDRRWTGDDQPAPRKRRAQPRVPGSEPTGARGRAAVKVKAPPRLPVSELVELARHLEALTGERFGSPERLRKRFELLLRDPVRLGELLELLRE
jgi:transglutaminase-like putative cysteine protease